MNVSIVGAGISGLSLGIMLQKEGIQTHIYEKNPRAGGLCTGWSRGGYHFNGCLHWLLGSREGTSFYHMWRDVLGDEQLQYVYFDERVRYEVPLSDGSSFFFTLYNDIDRLEQYLNTLHNNRSDARLVRRWMQAIRTVVRHLPDMPPLFNEPTAVARVRHALRMWRMAEMLPFMLRWGRLTNLTFARRFRSERLREAVSRLYMDETSMQVVIVGQAYMARRVAGYPLGGSEALTVALIRNYKRLGGVLHTNSLVCGYCKVDDERRITDIIVKSFDNGRIVEQSYPTDFVCSTVDYRQTLLLLADKRYKQRHAKLLAPPKEAVFYSYCRVNLGVSASLADMPHYMRVVCDITLPCGTHHSQMEIEVNNYDHKLLRPGQTTLTVNFTTREGLYWARLREFDNESYQQAKDKIAADVVRVLRARLADQLDTDKIEVVDVCTPATYYRYTANTYGSSQGWTPSRNLLKNRGLPITLKNVGNLVIAGHWTTPGGGLPIALLSARRAFGVVKRWRDKEK